MTRPIQKDRERFFTEQAARPLGKIWIFNEDGEHPDFFVTEGDQQFRLEVCEVFMGPQSHAGSAMKKNESTTQRRVDDLRLEYKEAIADIPLTVKFAGDMSAANMATVVAALIAEDLPSISAGRAEARPNHPISRPILATPEAQVTFRNQYPCPVLSKERAGASILPFCEDALPERCRTTA
jgi:hypothetical protein